MSGNAPTSVDQYGLHAGIHIPRPSIFPLGRRPDYVLGELEPWPAPLVPETDVALDSELVPASARRLAKLADSRGWRVRAVYSLGYGALRGKPFPTPAHCLSIRMRQPGACRVAVWDNGKFGNAYAWSDCVWRRLSYDELKGML